MFPQWWRSNDGLGRGRIVMRRLRSWPKDFDDTSTSVSFSCMLARLHHSVNDHLQVFMHAGPLVQGRRVPGCG